MMTYDDLTRRPVPVFPFLVGRDWALGVAARDDGVEPGARWGWKPSAVGELSVFSSES
jgi:hypothetical protein